MKAQPDKSLVKDQLSALQSMLKAWGVPLFLSSMFWILVKREDEDLKDAGRILPFRLNALQLDLLKNLARNNLLLKARQVGGTTFFILVRGLLNVITTPGTNAVLISQSSEFATLHFEIAHRASRLFAVRDPYNDTENDLAIALRQNLLHTKFKNKREIYYDQIESTFRVASAEVEESGQGHTLHHIIASEYSRWPKDPAATLANVRGALVPGGTVDKECTANGAQGPFFQDYLRAVSNPDLSDAKAHFYPWWWTDEYSISDISEEQKDEMEKDLTADEIAVIKRIHYEMNPLAWTGTPQNRVYVP